MKASDSATSLTGLQEGTTDTGCFFCAEEADAETGQVLISSHSYSSCKCRYKTHIPCWMEYLRDHPPTQAGAITCPSCKEEIIPRISMPTPQSKDKAKKLCRVSESRCLAVAGTAAVALLILIVYFTVSHR